ncbi:MAG: hypothetical protein HYS12_20890 [Planctomycetes bacterium]|nr:hypothetical protein [Planctomycetota bacterium]
MRVTYSERTRQAEELFRLAQAATDQLEQVLGPSAELVDAEWDRAGGAANGDGLALTLRDLTGEARAFFSPCDLKNPSRVSINLHRLWGDLLQARSHKQLQELLSTG